MLTRRGFAALATASGLGLLGHAARGQGRYPDQPIRLIVPFPAGGPADIVGRLVAQALREQFKQSVVVENRAGAGGVVGVDAVAKAPPDGATLGIASSGALSVLPTLMPRMPYDVQRDIQPISVAVVVPQVLAVIPPCRRAASPNSVDLAKRQPGSISLRLCRERKLAAPRGGTVPRSGRRHSTGARALSRRRAGAHRPRRRTRSDDAGDLPAMLPHAQAGAVRALGVTRLSARGACRTCPP
jgi:hypothetical protein